jgi:hypothetical protein
MKKLAFFSLLFTFLCTPVLAQEYSKDLALEEGSIRTQNNVIVGKTVRIYATVKNNSDSDLFGTVKFYDEQRQEFIGQDQPVSVVGGSTDDVFVDWQASNVGNYPISARVVPWDDAGDNPDNNKITTSIYVDIDSDGDGVSNSQDPDDDNDGVPDVNDAFPTDPAETTDTDGDGIGNNADEDDDGDGTADIQDVFPTDSGETVDTDGDGVGDNADVDSNNKGPVPTIYTEDNVVSTGDVVTFSALRSEDEDGEIVTYEWDFGEGVASTSVIADHVFEKPGTYEVKLKVIDDKGEYRTGVMTVTVIYKWQTIALILIILLLFLLLCYNLRHTKKALAKKKKKK